MTASPTSGPATAGRARASHPDAPSEAGCYLRGREAAHRPRTRGDGRPLTSQQNGPSPRDAARGARSRLRALVEPAGAVRRAGLLRRHGDSQRRRTRAPLSGGSGGDLGRGQNATPVGRLVPAGRGPRRLAPKRRGAQCRAGRPRSHAPSAERPGPTPLGPLPARRARRPPGGAPLKHPPARAGSVPRPEGCADRACTSSRLVTVRRRPDGASRR